MSTTTTRAPGAVDRFLDAVAAGSVPADLYTPDVTLDAVVPGWRLRVHGAVAVAAEYARWFTDPARIEELRRLRTTDGGHVGEVVEYTLCWTEHGVPHAARHVHLLDVHPDGRISADHVWCGGRWPAALLAEMGAEMGAGMGAGMGPEMGAVTGAVRDAH